MNRKNTPYRCHVFVCSNVRDHPDRPGCGAAGGGVLKARLKKMISQRGWAGSVRVSTTGCMGLCSEGPNILLHPQKIHYSSVSEEDLPEILESIKSII